MRFLMAIASIPMALFASAASLEERLDTAVLQELSACFQERMEEGSFGEYGAYRDLCSLWMHLPSTQGKIATAINEIISFHEGYILGIGAVCENHPEDTACKQTSKELQKFLKHYDKEKIALCLSLFLFPVIPMEPEDQSVIENVLLDYMVKKHLICNNLEGETAKRVNRLLDKSLVQEICAACASSDCSFLQEVCEELVGITRPVEYWNKYRFVPSVLEESLETSEKPTDGECALKQVCSSFFQQEKEYKDSYSKVFGD